MQPVSWADSPFQFEVATASLGFAAVGFIAAFGSFDLRLAAMSYFLLGNENQKQERGEYKQMNKTGKYIGAAGCKGQNA